MEEADGCRESGSIIGLQVLIPGEEILQGGTVNKTGGKQRLKVVCVYMCYCGIICSVVCSDGHSHGGSWYLRWVMRLLGIKLRNCRPRHR